jgi:hypothetical protein
MTNGYKCKAAALRGQAFCYYHTTARRYASIRTTSKDPILFPTIEDTGGVQIALNQVLRELGAHRIDRRQAGVFFYGLQLAEKLARKSHEKPADSIREVCEGDDNTGTLAPEKITCEPPADCVHCGRRDFCEDFDDYEDEVEELEACLLAEKDADKTRA